MAPRRRERPEARQCDHPGFCKRVLTCSTFLSDVHGQVLAVVRDDEWVVRYAAAYGLERRLSLTPPPEPLADRGCALLQELSEECRENVKVVRLRAQLALQRLSTG